MTKDQMIQSIKALYNSNKDIFELIKVPEEKFYKWFDKFQTYDEIKKVNSYCHKGPESLFAVLAGGRLVMNLLTHSEWTYLRMNFRGHKEVLLLNAQLKLCRDCWSRKPKSHDIRQASKKDRAARRQFTHRTYEE